MSNLVEFGRNKGDQSEGEGRPLQFSIFTTAFRFRKEQLKWIGALVNTNKNQVALWTYQELLDGIKSSIGRKSKSELCRLCTNTWAFQ